MATGGGIKAGKAFVIIEALDKTKAGLQGVHQSLRQFGSDIAAAGQNILMKAIGALIPVGLSEKIYAEFDDSMRKVEARSSGTAGELSILREEAKRLGRETAFTSSHIAELQAKLAQKGFNRGDIFKMTEPVTNLARAAGEGSDLMQDASTAATLVAGTLRAYKMEAKDATRVADLFTTTINNSNFTLEELGNSLQFVGPEAHAFGQSLEETLALLAGLRDLNIDASIAGTSLRNMFTYLSKGAHQEKFNEQLQALTGNTIEFSDAAGNLHKIPDLLLAIQKATAGLGTAQRSSLLSEMFGTRVVVSAGAIGRNIEEYNKMLFKLESQSEGAAKRTHDKMEAGIGGIFREFMSSIEAVALSVGESLAPALAIATTVGDKLSKMFSLWILNNKAAVLTVVGVVVAVGLLGLSLTMLGITISVVASLISSAIIILTVLTAALEFVLTPIGLIVIAAAALVVALGFLAYIFSDLVAEVLSLAATASGLTGFFATILNGSMAAMTILFRLGKAMGRAFAMGDLKLASELAWAEITVLWLSAVDGLIGVWDSFVGGMRAGVDLIKFYFTDMIRFMMTQMTNFITGFQGMLGALVASPTFAGIAAAMEVKLGISPLEGIEGIQKQLEESRKLFDPSSIAPESFLGHAAEEEAKRAAEAAKRKKAIDEAVAARDKLLHEAETKEPETPENIDDILRTKMEEIDRRADDLLKAGGPGGIVAPKANMGLEAGSVEAAKQFQENLYNQTTMLNVAKEHLEVAKAMKEDLDGMALNLRNLELGEVG